MGSVATNLHKFLALRYCCQGALSLSGTSNNSGNCIIKRCLKQQGLAQRARFHAQCAAYADAASITADDNYATGNELLEAAPSTGCKPTLRQFNVRLQTALAAEEQLALTGDVKALGEWQLSRCVPLDRLDELSWQTTVRLQSCRQIEYRYFVYVEDAAGNKQIRRWETHFKPRLLLPCPEQQCNSPVDAFGIANPLENTQSQVHRGWLNHEAIVQLKFNGEKMFQVHDIETFDPQHVQLKIVPVEQSSGLHVEYSKQLYGRSQLQLQPQFGVPYTKGDIVIFHITLPLEQMMLQHFRLECYSLDHQLLGSATLNAAQLTGSEGLLQLHIKSAQRPEETLARLRLPYVLVQPYQYSPLDFKTTYAHYWPRSWPNLDVGHRGNGKSYIAEAPQERENTIASFLSAHAHHADMVELDVHLTADGIPVIYHDFGLRTAPPGKQIEKPDQLEYVLIKDINYELLKRLRIFSVINGKVFEYPAHNAEPRTEHRIFPRLVEVLQQLPKSLGIDVEIKWPQRRQGGGSEAEQTIDKNFFADRVLHEVIRYGCGRPLIFSSFDADMCTMLRFKQNIFPVMFLTQGETKKWQPFSDLRTRNFMAAVNNAQAFELAGTAPHAEDFLGENAAQMLQQARDQGQIAVIWGDDCNSKERVQYFTQIGATATCYDRSDLYMPEAKQRAFFNSSALLAEFEGQCRI
ncbi:glycerophosphocholine phosphodiesterase GPCPD1 isoform X1 [Drosophila nasuta]|uniref:glycerophosphocholine phosphodiesterase GPCPD1 isoform X1 n=1 Tax=Drosophila nasuta TaxID=42062 RepID=UPI00295E7553|nr:glycerophosphocholine phosphodiesterase GPCPD1 isoform X1 [Drosophila nasuta]